MVEVPRDYVQDIIEKILESKIETVNVKIKEIKNDVAEVKNDININHNEVRGMFNNHFRACDGNMEKHDDRIRDLEKHKSTANGFFAAIGFVLTILGGYIVIF